MMSLFLGVLAVVVVQAGAETAKRAALDDVELLEGKDGTLQLYLPSDAKMMPLALDTVRGRTDSTLEVGATAIIGEPGVTPVNPGAAPFDSGAGIEFSGDPGASIHCNPSVGCFKMPKAPGLGQPPGQAVELRLAAMTSDIRQFRPFRPVAGQWLDFASPPSLAPRIVVNKEAAKGFLRHQVPAEMRIEGAKANMTPVIIGVVDDGRGEPTAYTRMDELLNWIDAPDLASRSGLHMLLAPSATDVVPILRAKMAANGQPADALHTERVRSKERVAAQLALIQAVFLGLAALVLLIGVAGILNVGLATVGERVEEFALRRAVGTPRMLLAGIVLAETMATGLLTAAAAIGVAAVALKQVGKFAPPGVPSVVQHLDFPWQAGVAGIIAGLVAGLLGGLIPAIRAARIPIATVMRA
jgi:putative ABC transport system permease protein